ncbi:MAG TPA: polysaccharide deacetylase family protein, partial [Bryobacteraceae bacterium]|nr:polysaccharide deacetylase family protein [Bryobacteraceae bacterium]
EANFETTVSAEDFAEHLAFLLRWRQPVTLSDVRAAMLGGRPLPRRAVLITFDDGYRNVYTHAAPVLQRYGVPAVVFLSTGYIDTDCLYWYDEVRQRLDRWGNPLIERPSDGSTVAWPVDPRTRETLAGKIRGECKRVPDRRRVEYLDYLRARMNEPLQLTAEQHHILDPMSWQEASKLLEMGFEIGSHTVTHPILTNLPAEELNAELAGSKAEIERRTARACYSIAWPNGTRADFSPMIADAAKAAGYDLAFTMVERMNGPESNPYMLSRITAPGHVPLTALRVRASGLYSILNG